MEIYLGIGDATKKAWPTTYPSRLREAFGHSADLLQKRLDSELSDLLTLPDEWTHLPVSVLGQSAKERALRRFPRWSAALGEEFANYYCYQWR